MNIAIIGTGYVGLVSGACLAELGHEVTCVDTDEEKIKRLQSGVMPIYEPGLEELVKKHATLGRLKFTTSYAEAVPQAEVISLAVGTPSAADGSVDIQYVKAAAQQIARHLRDYVVIADKSTVPVGTAEQVADWVRENYHGEFDVVSNPEFLREGHAVHDFLNPSRVIIGSSSPRASETMKRLYAAMESVLLFMSVRTAELTKYAANAFLATKISFINEMAHLAEEVGANVDDLARGIGMDPRIGQGFLRAGLGWGGSCFPKDVRALRSIALQHGLSLPITAAACEVNERARTRIVERVEKALGGLNGKTICILGLTFKNDTDDTRESGALDLVRHFAARGASVRAYDPLAVVLDENVKQQMQRAADPYEAMTQADAVVIATEWGAFKLLDLERVRRTLRGNLIMDARNLLDPENVKRAGLEYLGVGRT